MFKLVLFTCVLAVASAGLIGSPIVGSIAAGPLAYAAAPAFAAHPIAYSAPVAVPAPITYTSGYRVAYNVEPVEQHGYKIAY